MTTGKFSCVNDDRKILTALRICLLGFVIPIFGMMGVIAWKVIAFVSHGTASHTLKFMSSVSHSKLSHSMMSHSMMSHSMMSHSMVSHSMMSHSMMSHSMMIHDEPCCAGWVCDPGGDWTGHPAGQLHHTWQHTTTTQGERRLTLVF